MHCVIRQGSLYLAGVGRRDWAWWTAVRGEARPYDADEADRLARAIRDDGEDDWLCYVSIPIHAYHSISGNERGPWPGEVFLVFINGEGVVYNWRWEACDTDQPHLPENWQVRFRTKLL